MNKNTETTNKPYGLTMRGIAKKNGKIAILRRHLKSRTNPHKWELPGGKVDSGEFFDEALIREMKEETNLDVSIGDFYEAIQDDYIHKRTVQVIMKVNILSEEFKISDEHDNYKWADLEEIKLLYQENKLSTAFAKVLEKKNFKI